MVPESWPRSASPVADSRYQVSSLKCTRTFKRSEVPCTSLSLQQQELKQRQLRRARVQDESDLLNPQAGG